MNLLPRDRLIAAIAQTVIFWGGFGSLTNRGHICQDLSWLMAAALTYNDTVIVVDGRMARRRRENF